MHARQHGSHSRTFLQENVPLGNVRQVMSQLLKSGKLRRILACAPTPATSSASASVAGSSTAHALKMLVLNTLPIAEFYGKGAPRINYLADLSRDRSTLVRRKLANVVARWCRHSQARTLLAELPRPSWQRWSSRQAWASRCSWSPWSRWTQGPEGRGG